MPGGSIGKCSDEIAGGSLFFGTDGGVMFTLSGSHLDLTLLGSLADLPVTGPYAVSAEIVGNQIRVEQTVAQTPSGAVTNRTTKTFATTQ